MGDVEEPEEDFDDDYDEPFSDDLNYPRVLLLSLLRQFYCCSGTLLLPLFGAVTEQDMLTKFAHEDFELTFLVGEVVGFVFGGIFMSIFGRKFALIISNLSYLIIISISSNSIIEVDKIHLTPVLLAVLLRFTTVAFIFYVVEISNVTFRAFFLGFYYTISHLGHYFLFAGVTAKIQQSIQIAAVLAFISSLASVFVPETPYYLASKGKLEEAEHIFTWVRADTVDIFEYELMLDKAESSVEPGRLMQEIFSSTFVVCMIMCALLKVCNFSACELYQDLILHLYLRNGLYEDHYISLVWDNWIHHAKDICYGGFIFICINFIVSRKILYGMGFVLTLLLVVPVIVTPSAFSMIVTLFPNCFIISYAAREPLALILPLEILPTLIRSVGLMVVFIFEKMIHVFTFYTASSDVPKLYYFFRWAGKDWIFSSYAVSLIGIPFLLIFMPETKGRSIFDIEIVSITLVDFFPPRNIEESSAE